MGKYWRVPKICNWLSIIINVSYMVFGTPVNPQGHIFWVVVAALNLLLINFIEGRTK